jgi:hypothetical protein
VRGGLFQNLDVHAHAHAPAHAQAHVLASRNSNTSLVVLDQEFLLGGIIAEMMPPLHHAADGINFEDN